MIAAAQLMRPDEVRRLAAKYSTQPNPRPRPVQHTQKKRANRAKDPAKLYADRCTSYGKARERERELRKIRVEKYRQREQERIDSGQCPGSCDCGEAAWRRKSGSWVCPSCLEKDAIMDAAKGGDHWKRAFIKERE